MATNIDVWRTVVEDVVRWIADEQGQRRAWFGIGPEVSSPDEDFCAFFDDAAVPEFLDRADARLNATQREAGERLVRLMHKLADATPEHIAPETLIDDPRWQEVRRVAANFLAELSCSR
jgi:hypothetical protein